MTDLSIASSIQASNISPEEQNYLRIANLLLTVAPTSVRVKFDNEFYAGGLKTILNRNRFNVLEYLKQKRVISQAQWNLLFPISGIPSSETFDVSLMICLIRHLTNIEVGDELPFPGKKSDGADLTRIKYYRNKIVHSTDGILSESNFKIWWDEVSQEQICYKRGAMGVYGNTYNLSIYFIAETYINVIKEKINSFNHRIIPSAIIRLGGTSFKDRCSLMRFRKLESNDKEIITEIKNYIGTLEPTQKGLRKLMDEAILKWKKENVAETRAITRLAEMIASDNVALAVGPSGCGKSTAIHYIALQLAEIHKYDIVIAYNPEDMRQLFNPDCKQVFIIDDILGVATFDENKARKWVEMSNEINRILEGDHVKLLASCKTHIFQHRKVQTIEVLSNFSCNFVSIDYSLTDKERENIANCHLTADEIVLLKSLKSYSAFDFFPVLCRLYSIKKSANIVDFFSNPIESVSDDLYLLLTDYDQTTFATLFLFVVYNNRITESLFTEPRKIKPLLEDISDHFICKTKFSIQVVKDELEKLKNSYVKKKHTAYTIIHDKIFDILMCFCGKHKYDLMLEVAHTDIIRDRFIFKRSRGENVYHVNVVDIPLEKEKKYLERLKKDSEQGFILNVFLNQNLNDTSFRSKFITHIVNETIDSLSDKKIFLLLMSMIDRGFCDIVSVLLTKKINFDRIYWDGETPLFKAACKGFTKIVRFLLINNADPNFPSCFNSLNYVEKTYPGIKENNIIDTCFTYHVYSPPPLKQSYGFKNVRSRFGSNSDSSVEYFKRENNEGPITAKSYLKVLSSKKKPQFERQEAYKILPLHIAVSKGYTDVVKLLLTHNAEPDYDTECHQIESPLCIASNQGNTEIVKLLLENKPKPKVTVPTGQTIKLQEYSQLSLESSLHVAVEKGFYDIVRLLLIHKDDLYQYHEHLLLSTPHTKFNMTFYWNMFLIAIFNGHDEIVKLFLEQDCNLNMCDKKNMSPLFISICEKKTAIAKLLLEHNFDPNICSKKNESPLFRATIMGQIEIVKLLLTHKSDPNVCYEDNISPLFAASYKGYTEIVNLLLDHKCDLNLCNKDNESPLLVASSEGYTEIVKLLIDHNSDPNVCNKNNVSPLYAASSQGRIEIVKYLLDHCSDPNFCSKDNVSPLLVASFNGRIEIIKLLLKYCDPNVCNRYKKSPLFDASYYGHTEIVKLLLEHNCDPNVYNKDNESPLFGASFYGHTEIVKLLLEHNCDPNVYNKDNESPLFVASSYGHTEIVKLLLDHYCDPHVCNKDNESPLFAASSDGRTEIIELLLEHNCDPNVCNIYNRSPLFAATTYGRTDIVKLLLKHNCDPNVCYNNISPLLDASHYGRTEIVKLLLEHNCDSNICNKYNK